ncbi:MAG: antibiotic biosynthesis monooxygenase [Planctomycetota bacterium]
MASECSEVVVYAVRPERREDFHRTHARVLAELAQLPGFRAARTLRALDAPARFVDEVTWDSEPSARAAHAAFRSLPGAPAFLATIARVEVALLAAADASSA